MNREKCEIKKEEPAFTLHGTSTIGHTPDAHEEIYWSDLKEAETGDEWSAEANSSCSYATVLYKDDEGCFIRFVHVDTNEYTDYPDKVHMEYFDFGR